MHIVLNFFYTTWVRGVAYQKQLSGPKLMKVWAMGASKNGTPCNFKFGIQLGLEVQLYQETTFAAIIGGGPG